MDFDIERLCRIRGRQPTARERWTAFYRLWRIIRHTSGQMQEWAAECFRVLMFNWKWIQLVQSFDLLDPTLPLFLRRETVRIERAKRLAELP